jgi:hypothetical protein
MFKLFQKYFNSKSTPLPFKKGVFNITSKDVFKDEIKTLKNRKKILLMLKENSINKNKSDLSFDVFSYINKEIFDKSSDVTDRHVSMAIKKVAKIGDDKNKIIDQINNLVKIAGIFDMSLSRNLDNDALITKCLFIMNKHEECFHELHSYMDSNHEIHNMYLSLVSSEITMPVTLSVNEDSYKVILAFLNLNGMGNQIKIVQTIGSTPYKATVTNAAYCKIKKEYDNNDKIFELIKSMKNESVYTKIGYVDMHIHSEDIGESNKIDEYIKMTNVLVEKIIFLNQYSSFLLFIKNKYEQGVDVIVNEHGYSIEINPYTTSSQFPFQFIVKDSNGSKVGCFNGLYEQQNMIDLLILNSIHEESFKTVSVVTIS